MSKRLHRTVVSLASAACLAAGSSFSHAAPAVQLVGVSQPDPGVLGLQADAESKLGAEPALSGDGRYLVFGSSAGNLVSGDTNGLHDVFWRDLSTGATRRVTVTEAGTQVSAGEGNQSISEDGRFVAFSTKASGLVPEDTDNLHDVFVLDTQLGTLRLASVGAAPGTPGNSAGPTISGDGRYVAFTSQASDLVVGDTNGFNDTFVRDLTLNTTVRASVADTTGAQATSHSYSARISRDGNVVAFLSYAGDLVAGDTNSRIDAFVRNLSAGTTVRASVGDAGQQANLGISDFASSPSGSFIAFVSDDPNLVAGDTNAVSDIFVRSLPSNTTMRVSIGAGGEANGPSFRPSISGNAAGQAVAFLSSATNLVSGDSNGQVDAYVRRVALGTTVRASVSGSGTELDESSDAVSISVDGLRVAFRTGATNVVQDDRNLAADIFLRDLTAGTTVRANLADSTGPFPASSTGESYRVATSDGGRHVAFLSLANNLLQGDNNGFADAFVRDTLDGSLVRASLTATGGEINSSADDVALSTDGNRVIFESAGDNLVTGDLASFEDVFVRNLALATTQRASLFGAIEPNSDSEESSASADGRYVAYVSYASNFPGVSTSGIAQVYVVDTQTGATTLASVNAAGQPADRRCEGSAISDDGRYVAFASEATNLAPSENSIRQKLFRRDLWLGQTVLVDVAAVAPPADSASTLTSRAISGDGRYIAFESAATNLVAGDSNDVTDIFVRDLVAGTTTRANLTASGEQASDEASDASISADGRFVAFSTRDMSITGALIGWSQVVLRDLLAGTTQVVSVDAQATRGTGDSRYASISRDGRNIGFQSHASNWTLAAGGENPLQEDAFVVRLVEPTATTITAISSPSAVGSTTTVTAEITGSDSEPRGAGLRISATTGEFCITPGVTRITSVRARASCAITFASVGPRTLTAAWLGTANYLASSSAALAHQVLPEGTLFRNGFETP